MMIETLVKQFCASIHAAAGRTTGSAERGRTSADRQETRGAFVFPNLSIPGDGLFSQCPTNGVRMVGAARRFQCGQHIDPKPFRVAFAPPQPSRFL
jgi:hypothetical protein